ncbi:MAG: ferritin-like protein [Myxococcales bacterium]|nr:ferritin-like protein [Myxococcales bacterium]
MIRIDPKWVEGLQSSRSREELYLYLQKAIELEHSTIPPYLTAYYSLKPGLNDGIGNLLRSIVIEEMLHMTIAANILVSIGGAPSINGPGFVPRYPGPLPMGIGGKDFVVPIAAFSLPLVKGTFMVIEEPEEPIPVGTLRAQPPHYRTIGEFYDALKEKLRGLDPSAFGHVDRQVVGAFSKDQNFPIKCADTACQAIDIIVRQGEGSAVDPFEAPGEPAHYYRFGEICYGSKLIRGQDGGFLYGGAPIAFVSDGVFPMKENPTADQFPRGTFGRLLSDNFTEGYRNLLNALHLAFNGEPERISAALGLMYQLRLLAQRLMGTPLEADALPTAGPVYTAE